ncbi:MAG: hypothetical protein H6508_02640 [Calditrichaeota bacterium]|nr:hypothetical protein [Calditrichota bacterium]
MSERQEKTNRPSHEGTCPSSSSFVPENRSTDCLLFRRIRKRIEEGYYDTTQVLTRIAERLAPDRRK